jgi:hypothetical protein
MHLEGLNAMASIRGYAATLNTVFWMQGDRAATCFVHVGIRAYS